MFGFEKLDVWQKSVEFADQIYRLTASFPSDERFGLMSQLNYINHETLQPLLQLAETIAKMLSRLRTSLQEK